MGNFTLVWVGILSYLFGVTILLIEYFNIKKKNKLEMIDYVRIFYALIYGITPGSLFFYVFYHGNTLFPYNYISFDNEGINALYFNLIFSFIAFILINFGYYLLPKSTYNNPKKSAVITINILKYSGLIIFVLGFVSLLLWTHAYGGPFGILPYANSLRAGRDVGIYNPFTFFMRGAQLLIFSSYLFFIVYLQKKQFSILILFLISTFFTSLYLFANSGRMMFIIFFLTLIFINYDFKSLMGKRVNIKKILLLFILSLILMNASEAILNVIQTNSYQKIGFNFNILQLLREEFFFPSINIQVVTKALESGVAGSRIFIDLPYSIFAWLPTRFKPSDYVTLEITNTLLRFGTLKFGGLPTDFITTCLYELGYFGLFFLPTIFGLIIKLLENKFVKFELSIYHRLLYFITSFYLLKIVAYADFSNIMINIFYIVVSDLIVKFVYQVSQFRRIDKRMYLKRY